MNYIYNNINEYIRFLRVGIEENYICAIIFDKKKKRVNTI